MPSKPRQLPIEISSWVEKDVSLSKPTARSSLLPIDTKENGVLNRQFFSDMLDLSSERYRTLSRFNLEKQNFLENQRTKAQTFMPGLLPHIEQLTPTTNRSLSSSRLALNKNDQIISSLFQSNSPRTVQQSEVTKKNEILQPIPTKPRSIRQQLSLERINRLAQPRGRPLYSTDHVRSHLVQPITVQDLFGHLDNIYTTNSSLLSVPSKHTTSDTRFNQLFNIFSDVHKPQSSSSELPSVKNIVQSNPSLQDEEGRWQMANIPLSRTAELKKHIQKVSKQFSSKSNIHIMDLCTC